MMATSPPLLLLIHLALASSTNSAATREKINFDFAWRHYLGTPPSGNPQTTDYDDKSWQLVDAPHDMLMGQRRQFHMSKNQGYIARGAGWYRKHFQLPAEWKNSGGLWIYIEGAFHVTTAWLNGEPLGGTHKAGYTSFYLPVHTAASAKWGGSNVLALHVNASSGTGWWYEGGGLVRHNWIVRTPSSVYVEPDGAWAHVALSEEPKNPLRSAGVATVAVEAAIRSDEAAATTVALHTVVYDESGKVVSSPPSTPPPPPTPLPAGSAVTLQASAELPNGAELWSIPRPYLYTVALAIVDGASGQVLDALNVTVGARTIGFAASGFKLNGASVKLRGFCDHSNFGAVGAAMPDRLNLFRLQGLRGVGGNAWRMAHNPPIPSRLDLMDALGVVAMDENRDFGGAVGQGGVTDETIKDELADTAAMVKRDRSHPSIVLWSLCNEVGCRNESAAAAFREVIRKLDTTRPITQNHLGVGKHPLSMQSLDVQGFSHKHADAFAKFHSDNPTVPMVASECCSCLSQRGEDTDWCPHPRPTDGCSDDKCHKWCGGLDGSNSSRGQFFNNEISQCTATQVNISDGIDEIAGTFVWSGFDYLGEARGWPQISKPRGTIADTAGFIKESFYWLRQWWLSRIPTTDAGRPPLADAPHTAFIVDSWKPRLRADGTPMPGKRTIHVYTDAPYVRMEVNGKAVGGGGDGEGAAAAAAAPIVTPAFGNVEVSVDYAPGNLTAVALAKDGKTVLATHTRLTSGEPSAIRLSLDAPSPKTGTGSALVADGEDVALVRAEVIDAEGRLCDTDVSTVVKFAVASGEGALWATANGDPADTSRDSPYSPSRQAYYGLARAVVRSTSDHSSTRANRRRMREIDLEGGGRVADPDEEDEDEAQAAPLKPIVVEATAKGLASAYLHIPLSRDRADLPYAVARRSVGVAWRG